MNSFVRNLLFVVLLVGAASLSSCRKLLDPSPKDLIFEENFPKDYWDAEFMMRGAYGALQPLVEYKFILGEMRADWVTQGTGVDADLAELSTHQITDKNRYTDWKLWYDLINRANYAIKNIPRIPANANYFTDFQRNQYIGEARFLRSWAYFHLIENFDAVPFVWEAVDDITHVPYLPATPQDVILDSIEADLVKAYNTTDIQISVPNSFDAGFRVSPEQTKLRVTKGTVCALQAEVYLWRSKFQLAANACQNWQNTGAYPFLLNGSADWFNLFALRDALYNSPMFLVDFSFASRQVSPLMRLTSNDPASGGQYFVAPSLLACKTYNPSYPTALTTNTTTDEQFRGFGMSYVGSAPFYNRLNSAPVIWKYIGLGRVLPASIDVPASVRSPYQSDARYHVYRQADVYLLWAEALNRLGDKNNAITRINSVRGRAGMTAPTTPSADSISVNSSADKIEDYILRERGLELGFEGRRWYDLLRIARRNRPRVLIDAVKRRVSTAQQSYIETRLSDTKNWYLPYNAEEKALNPYLK